MKGNFLSFIKDLIAPKKCYSCNIEGHFLCKNCFNKLSKFKSICYVCKKPSESFSVHNECKNGIYYDKIIILTHYRDNIISKLIKNSKFYNKKDILEDFSKYLSKLLESNLNIKNNKNILASVPMTFFKKMKRGYNVSEILSKNISEYLNISYEKNLIKRNKKTRQQSQLLKKERILNIKNAFKVDEKLRDKIDKKNIIIVDDVVSTGSTINEIAKILKKSGAKKVIALAIASN